MKIVKSADAQQIHAALQRVATGPHLSKDIKCEQAQAVMHSILDQSADPIQAGVFLIGLRMKRETDDEMKGILDALRQHTTHVTLDRGDVVVMAEPCNGFNRTVPGSLFVLPVLAACGLPAYSHGLALVGPKFGITHHAILKALGTNPLRSVEQVATRLQDPDIGWGYLDQAVFAPKLAALAGLRNKIVKRSALSTVETALCPISGVNKTHLIAGYVHKPYRETYAMLARHAGINSLLLVRGTEGGVIPSFQATAQVARYIDSEAVQAQEFPLEPLQLNRSYRALDIPSSMPVADPDTDTIGMKWKIDALADYCATEGASALQGNPGPLHDAAVFGAALVLWHTGVNTDIQAAVSQARHAIDTGEALRRFEAGIAAQ